MTQPLSAAATVPAKLRLRTAKADRASGSGPGQPSPSPSTRPRWRPSHKLTLNLAAIVTLLVIWQLVATIGGENQTLRPSPVLVARTLVDLSGPAGYEGLPWYQHLGVSAQRIGIGAGIGVLLGLVLGIVMGVVGWLRTILGPLLSLLRALPPLAYFSLVIIWFGIDETPKLVLLGLAAMPPIAVVTADAITQVPQSLIEAARSLGGHRLQVIRDILIPSALPQVITGVRLALAIAISSLVAAETVNGMPGIGGMIRDAQAYNNTAVVVVGLFAIGLSALGLDAVLAAVGRRVTPWTGKQ